MLNPSFTRGEYWLLEAVVESALPICWLDWAEIEEALNKSTHGMDRSLLIETMYKLFTEGLITAHRFSKWDETFILSLNEIEAALNEKHNNKEWFYRLTKKGGALWEAFARPKWELFVDNEYGLPENNDIWAGKIVCSNKEHLKGYFNSLCYHDYEVDDNTIQRDRLEPWQATYWKLLPVGFQIKFMCREKKKSDDVPVPPLDYYWYDSLWYQWR